MANNKFMERHRAIYALIWLPCAVMYIPLSPLRGIRWVKRWENFVDDPIDNLKHWINGRHAILGWTFRLRLPDWLMSGRGNPDK